MSKNILVISGGGIKGLCGLGSLKCLIDNNIITKPKIMAGSSVGAVICFLFNIGYDPKNIYEILEQIDFKKLVKYNEPENYFTNMCFGIGSPEPILQSIYGFMKKKGINKKITFKELYEKTSTKLIITGTCLNDTSVKYFSVDTYPNLSILKAIRISIGIPLIFRPYEFDNKLWVDGSVMNNFPIDIFDKQIEDVVGIYLDDHYEIVDKFNEIQDYFFHIFKCMGRGLNCCKIELFKKYFVHAISHGNHSTNWEITQEEKKHLYDEGYNSALKYLEL